MNRKNEISSRRTVVGASSNCKSKKLTLVSLVVVVLWIVVVVVTAVDAVSYNTHQKKDDDDDDDDDSFQYRIQRECVVEGIRGGSSNTNPNNNNNRIKSPPPPAPWEESFFLHRNNKKKKKRKKQNRYKPKQQQQQQQQRMENNPNISTNKNNPSRMNSNYDRDSQSSSSSTNKNDGTTNKKSFDSTIGKSSSSKQQRSSEKQQQQQQQHKKNDVEARPVTVNLAKYGKVVGRRHVSVDIFRGLPYAAPPVGALRFAPPEPVAPWAPSKLDASRDGPDCWQLEDPVLNPVVSADHMSEDCLYLNVYTPAGHAARSSKKRLPVMVWFHGGAFQQGGASRNEFDGRRLAERDIIVITLNYRLGALGFLVSSSDGLYGNYGLMDQRAALDWVQDNIHHFGGDPDNITLFGESAGAVMIGLHLMMAKHDHQHTKKKLFHKAIMQSNPLGYRFRSVVIADFIGEALKRAVDCRDLTCLRDERVEEIMRAQKSLMGVPRSVGDFFTWSPTLTKETKIQLSVNSNEIGGRYFFTKSEEHRLPTRLDTTSSNHHNYIQQNYINDWRMLNDDTLLHNGKTTNLYNTNDPTTITMTRRKMSGAGVDSTRWSAVNVSQPLESLDAIPHDIPIMIGTNQHEGEMFVHSAFPAPMPKAVYWMFVGALFRDSASRVLQHYRGLVQKVEAQADKLAIKQLEEEENKQYYLEHRKQLDSEYEMLLRINATNSLTGNTPTTSYTSPDYPNENYYSTSGQKKNTHHTNNDNSLQAIVNTWSTGGYQSRYDNTDQRHPPEGQELNPMYLDKYMQQKSKTNPNDPNNKDSPIGEQTTTDDNQQSQPTKTWRERLEDFNRQREEKRIARAKARALKEAAKVVVDYRPVMSAIINDYLFRCPSWHFAQQLSELRERQSPSGGDNIYVYRFSQPTHIPGYKECWGKSCHTAEIPYVFQSMDVLRSNYSIYGPHAQQEAPSAPEYPYSEIMAAYRGAFHNANNHSSSSPHHHHQQQQQQQEEEDRKSSSQEEDGKHWWGNDSHSSSTNSASSSSSGHSTRFQNILKHFFGDYFIEDADEELASDMADRWSSFAKEANPNYDGSRAEWNPWRYFQSEYKQLLKNNDDDDDETPYHHHSTKNSWNDNNMMDNNDFGEDFFWTEYDDEDGFSEFDDPSIDLDEDFISADDDTTSESNSNAAAMAAKDFYYRQRALDALNMEVVEEDVFRTELRRSKSSHDKKKEKKSHSILDSMFLKQKVLFRSTLASHSEDPHHNQQAFSKSAAKDAIRYAQYLGVLGTGLISDHHYNRGDKGAIHNQDFTFPELLDLSWPPEGRLLERDCTCDMWDRIRYRY